MKKFRYSGSEDDCNLKTYSLATLGDELHGLYHLITASDLTAVRVTRFGNTEI